MFAKDQLSVAMQFVIMPNNFQPQKRQILPIGCVRYFASVVAINQIGLVSLVPLSNRRSRP